MSISPISASSLYQEQINYFLNATRTDYNSVSDLLAKFGVKSSGDMQKDLVKLREIQTKTAINGLESITEDEETAQSAEKSASYSWYSIMYQLGLTPKGSPQEDFREIMTELVKRALNAENESEYNQYMALIDHTESVFIDSGVKISDITADSVSVYQAMDILSNYAQAGVKPEMLNSRQNAAAEQTGA